MPTLALSMIVKDAEATLGRCLESAQCVVDETVIADTGSADHSVQIARQYGATVFSVPWERDFAKARNRSLSRVSADWVLVLDADEVLDPGACDLVPSCISREDVMGYTVHIKNYLKNPDCHLWDQKARRNNDAPSFARDFPAYVEHVNVRLFRRHPETRFEGCVHETVGYRMIEMGMRIEEASFFIHHLGFTGDDEVLAGKYLLYRDLGREKVRALPENALAHFELGVEECEHFHNFDEAATLFKRACQLNPRFGVAWLFYGRTLSFLGKYDEALEALERAEETGAQHELVLESRGDASYNSGEFGSARMCYQELIERQGESAEINSKLGLAETRLGLSERGVARLEDAIRREPALPEPYDRLITACAWLGRLQEAAEAAELKLTNAGPHPEGYLRAASLRAQLGEWPRVAAVLRQGLDRYPKDERLREALAEIERRETWAATEAQGDDRFNANDFESARRCYRQAIEGARNAPGLESKLGLTEVRCGRTEDGLAHLRQAIIQEMGSPALHDRLIAAHVWLGQIRDAAESAEQKLDSVEPPARAFRAGSEPASEIGRLAARAALVRLGLTRFPEDQKLRQAAVEIKQVAPSA